MEKTIGNRIKMLRNQIGLSMAAFGETIQMTNSNISKMEKDLRSVTDRTIAIICHEFNVSERWLRTGEGEMFVETQTFSLDEKAKQHNLSELEIDIMSGYMDLPIATRKELLKLFGSIYTKHAESVATVIDPIDEELERYRLELEAEKKGQTSLASDELKEKSSS